MLTIFPDTTFPSEGSKKIPAPKLPLKVDGLASPTTLSFALYVIPFDEILFPTKVLKELSSKNTPCSPLPLTPFSVI